MSNPKYPVFIPTKGRWEHRHTIRAFERIGVPFRAVVQPQEHDKYAAVVKDASCLLVLPSHIDGLVPTRNWIWDHAQALGTPYFWTFDDNIRDFYRMNRNIKSHLTSGGFMRIQEEFVERYENLAIAGMQYEMFSPRKSKCKPLLLNTRVYSNMLIKTDIPYRNQGVYNDDTDLCLRVLKDGWCTVLFYAFLAFKIQTMRVKGGNTPIYQGDGRLEMAKELAKRHPDCVSITWKWNRWQHHVDYRPFRNNRLRLKPGVVIPQGVNEYGMRIEEGSDGWTKYKRMADAREVPSGSGEEVSLSNRGGPSSANAV